VAESLDFPARLAAGDARRPCLASHAKREAQCSIIQPLLRISCARDERWPQRYCEQRLVRAVDVAEHGLGVVGLEITRLPRPVCVLRALAVALAAYLAGLLLQQAIDGLGKWGARTSILSSSSLRSLWFRRRRAISERRSASSVSDSFFFLEDSVLV